MKKEKLLFVIMMSGCGACEEAAPMVKAFAKAHPEIKVVKVDYSVVEWKAKWRPEYTPTYVAVVGRRKTGMRVADIEDLPDMEAWAAEVFV